MTEGGSQDAASVNGEHVSRIENSEKLIELRREIFRLHQQAEQNRQETERLREELLGHHHNPAFRLYRLLGFLSYHRRFLFPLAVTCLVCLVLAPLFILISIFPAGRQSLVEFAKRIPTLREMMGLISEHNTIALNRTRGKLREDPPLILLRPVTDAGEFKQLGVSRRLMQHFGQLGPQSRYKLVKIGFRAEMPVDYDHANIVRSLSRSEISLQRASLAAMAECDSHE